MGIVTVTTTALEAGDDPVVTEIVPVYAVPTIVTEAPDPAPVLVTPVGVAVENFMVPLIVGVTIDAVDREPPVRARLDAVPPLIEELEIDAPSMVTPERDDDDMDLLVMAEESSVSSTVPSASGKL